MDPLTAITQAGSLVNGVKSLMGAIKGKSDREDKVGGTSESFNTQLRKQMEAHANRFIQSRDQDGSGGLSATEFGGSTKLFSRLDVDGNGQLTAAELVRGSAGASTAGTAAVASTGTTGA